MGYNASVRCDKPKSTGCDLPLERLRSHTEAVHRGWHLNEEDYGK